MIEVISGWIDIQNSVFAGNNAAGITTMKTLAHRDLFYICEQLEYAVNNRSGTHPSTISNNIFAHRVTASRRRSLQKNVCLQQRLLRRSGGNLIDGVTTLRTEIALIVWRSPTESC